ncbi:hypothetical protein Tco_1216841 [Tanacetum coccineum]
MKCLAARSGNHGGRVIIHIYGGSGDIVVHHGLNRSPGQPLVLPPTLPVRPPFLPPCVAAVAWPALRVIILGGIIYTKEDIGNVRHRYAISSLMDTVYWSSEQ